MRRLPSVSQIIFIGNLAGPLNNATVNGLTSVTTFT